MKRVYLDNAATTHLFPEVIEAMTYAMKNQFGNPSSLHAFGRESKALIENTRRMIASHINTLPSEIIFTSGGTESNNMIIRSCVQHLGVTRIITQPIEHKGVLQTVLDVASSHGILLEMLPVNQQGDIDLALLEEKLADSSQKTLVSLMHGNNEIGNLMPLGSIAAICHTYHALFHSDCVQTMGHYPFDLDQIAIDFISASAHKMHGPKGVGFAYIRKTTGLKPILTGGLQERSMRAGTENLYGIMGLSKSFELSAQRMDKNRAYILALKQYAIEQLQSKIAGVLFAGHCIDPEKSLYSILMVGIPQKRKQLAFELDLKGIAISQGSACESGAVEVSHVIRCLYPKEIWENHTFFRISLDEFNTHEDIDLLTQALQS